MIPRLTPARLLLVALCLALGLAAIRPAEAATFTVSNTDDSGAGSLRQAILDANANPGADTIVFAIGATGSSQTILPASGLPALTDPVILDGWSQGGPGYAGPPLIELSGTALMGTERGLDIRGGGSTVRGLAIGDFPCDGVRLAGAGNNWIYGNYVGTDISGTLARPNGSVGNCYGLRITTLTTPAENNVVGTDGDGLGDALEGNLLSGNTASALVVETNGNRIAGNLIGTDATGASALANGSGVVLRASGNVLGTNGDGVADQLEGNVISGNNTTGVALPGGAGHVIAGNIIGLDAGGSSPLGNGGHGIDCTGSPAEQILIGSNRDGVSDDLEGNVISANALRGYTTFSGGCRHITISGNRIGTDLSGAVALGNGGDGLIISAGDHYTITNNIISANGGYGLNLGNGADDHFIAGNIIGSDVTGTADVGNAFGGIFITSGLGNIIGNNGDGVDEAAEGNLIGGNGGDGILLASQALATRIAGNRIGVQADGLSPLPNTRDGIRLNGNGAAPVNAHIILENAIAHNGAGGVALVGTTISNTLSANRIFANGGLGIDLNNDGVTLNDVGDADGGANLLQNFPELAAVANLPESVTITGTLASAPGAAFRLEFFRNDACDPAGFGEGQVLLGSAAVATDGDGDAGFAVTLPAAVPEGQFLTATATDGDGNTSEFSACLGPTGPVPDVPIAGLVAGNDGPVRWGQPLTLFAAIAEGTNVAYSWDPGDGSPPLAGSVVTYTYAAAGAFQATVSASNSAGLVQAETTVSVLPAGTIHGRVWHDADGDSFFGLGEDGLPGLEVIVDGVGTFATDADGAWVAPSLPLGVYDVSLTPPGGLTTDYPTQPAFLEQEGFYEVQFPLTDVAGPGLARLHGRVWSDANGDGLPNRDETPFAGHAVTLLSPESLVAVTDADGLFAFDSLSYSDEVRRLTTAAPPGHTPDSQTEDALLYEGNVRNAHFGFLPLGSIAGQVSGPANTAANRPLLLVGDGATPTESDGQGLYAFADVVGGYYSLSLEAPDGYFVAGPDIREFLFRGGAQVENWQIVTAGSLSLSADILGEGGATPLGGVPIQLSNDEGYDALHVTNPQGVIHLADLEPAIYTARPRTDLMGLGLVSSPVRRDNLIVHPDGGATAHFTLSAPQSVLAVCRSFSNDPNYPGPGFDCGVRVESLGDDGPIVAAELPAGAPQRVFGLPTPGTYSVTLTMEDGRFPGWPDYEQRIVVNAGTPTADVRYPYRLTPAIKTIDGYAFLDQNGNGLRDYEPFVINERNADAANGLTIELLDLEGNVLAATTTARQNSSNAGYFAFPDLAFGDYRVRFTPPAGDGDAIYAPTTPLERPVAVSPEAFPRPVNFGFEPFCGDCVSGRVYFDNGDGAFDPATDTPYPGQTIILTGPNGSQTTDVTDDSGAFRFDGLTPLASYLVELVWTAPLDPPALLTRPATPGLSGPARVDFPLLAADITPGAIVFYDVNLDGNWTAETDPLVDGVTVDLLNEPCASDGAVVESVVAAGGLGQFSAIMPEGGCIRPDPATLPPGVLPARPEGSVVAPLSSQPVPVPLIDEARTLLVQPFWDENGDGARQSGEEIIAGLPVRVIGVGDRATLPTGAAFYLPPGSYAVQLLGTPPGMEAAISQPATVVLGEQMSARHEVPLRFAGRINGVVYAQTGLGDIQFNGVSVELRDLSGAVVATTVTAGSRSGLGQFSFGNVPCGTYRLGVAEDSLPDGYRLAETPVVPYASCETVQQNIQLVPLGDVVGRIYWDGNFNGQYDPGEGSPTIYDVALVDEDGDATLVTPAGDGLFLFEDLTPGVRYNLTVPALQEVYETGIPRHTITDSPGWFTVDMADIGLNLGIGPYLPDSDNSPVYGQVFVQTGNTRQPVPGAVVGYAVAGNGPDYCDLANPAALGETTTDLDGRYLLNLAFQPNPDLFYCLTVVEPPGYEQVEYVPAAAAHCWNTGQDALHCVPMPSWERDIELEPPGNGLRPLASTVRWSAYRDANVNGAWDVGEAPLPGVELSANGVAGVSGVDGSAELVGLDAGPLALSAAPPPGYALVAPEPAAWHTGGDLTLPPLAFRPAGMLVGSVFVDDDGDGRQSADEPGLGGVVLTLSGPVAATVESSLSGRFVVADLPDGEYTLSVASPVGFAPAPDQTVVLADGGVARVALVALGQVSGVVYEDWDGDGQRGPDELRVTAPFTLTLGDVGSLVAHAGNFVFWDVPGGDHELRVFWDVVPEATAAAGSGIALPAVGPGQVRGVAWLDANGDGRRQPGEAPLAGAEITVDGMTATTDAFGHWRLIGLGEGSYELAVDLPPGLATTIPDVIVGAGRGAAAGLAVVPNSAPLASAGPDQTATVGQVVTLDGTASSDPDGHALSYAWTQLSGPAVTLSGATSAQPLFMPPASGAYIFSLVVTDSFGLASPADAVTITAESADSLIYLPMQLGG